MRSSFPWVIAIVNDQHFECGTIERPTRGGRLFEKQFHTFPGFTKRKSNKHLPIVPKITPYSLKPDETQKPEDHFNKNLLFRWVHSIWTNLEYLVADLYYHTTLYEFEYRIMLLFLFDGQDLCTAFYRQRQKVNKDTHTHPFNGHNYLLCGAHWILKLIDLEFQLKKK